VEALFSGVTHINYGCGKYFLNDSNFNVRFWINENCKYQRVDVE